MKMRNIAIDTLDPGYLATGTTCIVILLGIALLTDIIFVETIINCDKTSS